MFNNSNRQTDNRNAKDDDGSPGQLRLGSTLTFRVVVLEAYNISHDYTDIFCQFKYDTSFRVNFQLSLAPEISLSNGSGTITLFFVVLCNAIMFFPVYCIMMNKDVNIIHSVFSS